MSELTVRDRVQRLEDEIAKMPQTDCPVKHYFTPGMYAREMTIPAGTILTSVVHKTEHLCVVSAGRIMVILDDGLKEIAAPCTFVSKPGAKRAGYALETTVWTTFHATNTTDLDALCEELTEAKADELAGGANNKQLLNQKQGALT